MRLPWTQLTEDGDRRARSFGHLIGVGPDAGVGFVTRLWRAALDLAPAGDFSGRFEDPAVLVAHAGGNPHGCTAEPPRVVIELQRVGLVATHPFLRVRGLDRYEATWRKNNKLPKSGGRPAETGGKPAPKTETETEKKNNNLVLMEVESTPAARAIFEHWRQATGKAKATLDRKRRDLIDRRLAEGHLPEDLKAAIDGYVRSPWHQGQNDRKRKYLGLELMLRDAEHIEAGLDLLMQAKVVNPQSESLSL